MKGIEKLILAFDLKDKCPSDIDLHDNCSTEDCNKCWLWALTYDYDKENNNDKL